MGADFSREMGLSPDLRSIVEAIQTIVNTPNTEHYIVEEDNQIVGVLSLIFLNDQWTGEYVCQKVHWYVKPDYRDGLGTVLLDLLENRAREEGCTEIRVSAFKEMRGFKPTETSYRKKI